jgi:hypothetical protein
MDNADVKRARMLFIQGRMSEEILRKILNRNSGNNESIDLTQQFNGGVYCDKFERNNINRAFR